MKRKKDLFERTPEFLAAFQHIAANGFFEELEVKLSSFEGRFHLCAIRGTGLIPNDPKYAALGVGTLADPAAMIEAARNQVANGRELSHCEVNVKTEDWHLWTEDEMTIIGSKGTKTTLSILITFDL